MKDIKVNLQKDLESELKIISFYTKNLGKLNYMNNRRAVDRLLFDSFKHARAIAKQICAIGSSSQGRITKDLREKALREEQGRQEVYRYELERAEDSRVRKLLQKLINEETGHERLVRNLKSR